MTLATHISNCIFLWRENRKEKVNTKINIDNILKIVSRAYKRKNSWVRNQTAVLIRKLRKEKPYRIQDYSEAKLLYNSITPIDLSKIKKGDYVVKFSRKEPIKGKRWCEYYVNESGVVGTYKIYKYNDNYDYWSVENYKEDWNTMTSLDEESSRSFRFATEAEIKDFENRRKKYLETKKEIDKKQEELSKLYKEL